MESTWDSHCGLASNSILCVPFTDVLLGESNHFRNHYTWSYASTRDLAHECMYTCDTGYSTPCQTCYPQALGLFKIFILLFVVISGLPVPFTKLSTQWLTRVRRLGRFVWEHIYTRAACKFPERFCWELYEWWGCKEPCYFWLRILTDQIISFSTRLHCSRSSLHTPVGLISTMS